MLQIVLILVVVEDVLVLEIVNLLLKDCYSLNPCCGGRCSSTLLDTLDNQYDWVVLILVVVEDVLVL